MFFFLAALIIAISCSAITIKTLVGYSSIRFVYKILISVMIVLGWFAVSVMHFLGMLNINNDAVFGILSNLLYGLMLRSGNDAAVSIAVNVADSMENFAMLMNETAQKIGMNDTYFYNAHGLEENDGSGNISTAYDMAILTKYAMSNSIFREIFGAKSYTVKTNYKTYSWTSKNKLIHSYDFITGGKTGFTEKARRTLVTTGSSNNINLVIVTLNDGNDFQDHITLYENIFRNYEAVKVIDKNNFKVKEDKEYSDDTLYVLEDIYVPVTKEEKKYLRIEYELYKNNTYIDGKLVRTCVQQNFSNGNMKFGETEMGFYGMKITENGNIIHQLVPFLDASGKACIKDEVTGKQYYPESDISYIE